MEALLHQSLCLPKHQQHSNMQLTVENILKLAPDEGTAQRAQELAHYRRWHLLAGNERALWGAYGNPMDPFLVAAHFEPLSVYCTCPVRRKPCKHGIGLLLTFLLYNGAFHVQTPPDWVQKWLNKTNRRASEQKEEKHQRSPKAEAALAEQRQRHRERRMAEMKAGLNLLENWILDLLRQGLASLDGREEEYFQQLATRMVDAKLGSLARRIRHIPQLMQTEDWPDQLGLQLGELYLLAKAYQKLPDLPANLQDDLLAMVGVTYKKDLLLANNGVHDHWLVAGQFFTEEDTNLQSRRTWLIGENTAKIAMLLDFSWAGSPYETTWDTGSIFEGELVFYPSAIPRRALVKSWAAPKLRSFQLPKGCADLEEIQRVWANALGKMPWLDLLPVICENMMPVCSQGHFLLVDSCQQALPMDCSPGTGWEVMAASAGRPTRIFALYSEGALRPMCLQTGSGIHFLNR